MAIAAKRVQSNAGLEAAGDLILRYGLVLVVAWIGAMKFTAYEATGIQPCLSPREREEDEDSSGAPGERSAPSKPALERKSLSSGFAIRGDGTIVTSRRAVEDAEQVTVRFANDPNPHDARVLGTDAATDLALLKISGAENTPRLSFAEPGTTEAGDWVVAIGNPFGLEQTLTAGIVSPTDRAIGNPPYQDFLQVNASLNPGDSGGPLLNVAGEVVGINSAVFREAGAGVGIAFALAGDTGRRLIDQLEAERGAEVIETPAPEPGEGELLVRVAARGACGSDLHLYLWELGVERMVHVAERVVDQDVKRSHQVQPGQGLTDWLSPARSFYWPGYSRYAGPSWGEDPELLRM